MTGFETTHGRSDTRWSKPQSLSRRRDRSRRDEGDWSGGAERRSPPSAPTLKVFLRELAARNVLGYIGEYGSMNPPLISATADKTSGQVPFTMNVDMSGSTDAGGTILSYYFNCGGGTFTPGSQISKGSCTFTTPGTYWLLMQVSDDKRNNDITSLYAVATPAPPGSDIDPPTVAITGPANGSYVRGN